MIFKLVSRIFVKLAPVARMLTPTAPCHHVLSSVKMVSCLVARRIQCSVAIFVVTG